MTIVWRLAYPLDFAHRKITFVVIRAEDLALRHTSEQRPEQVWFVGSANSNQSITHNQTSHREEEGAL